jgi:hypothetical protein
MVIAAMLRKHSADVYDMPNSAEGGSNWRMGMKKLILAAVISAASFGIATAASAGTLDNVK